ncbi:MAG TPA: hypothetical protein VMN57_03315 [Anaerolineales bacterium]|nr:hypothetical protein [Anaerolineales bacterium]
MHRGRFSNHKLITALAGIALIQLACFTSNKTIINLPDGSGRVQAEAVFPAALGTEIDPAEPQLALVGVARPPWQEGVGEQGTIDPETVFQFAMPLPWNVPALGALAPGQVAQAVNTGDAPPSSLTQLETLKILDAARQNSDPNVYNPFEVLAYAPVQLSGLDHKGVVVFPVGTDWRLTGVVLDPWIAAYPAGVPVAEWAGSVWVAEAAVVPEVDPRLSQFYPQGGGGQPSYPPDAERDAAVPPPPVGTFDRSLFARGSVSVLVVLPDDRHIGEMPAGGFINHLAGGAEMFKRAGAGGAFDWWTFLPATGYRVEIFVREAGALQVVVGESGFDIANLLAGELLSFTVAPDGTPGPVTRSGGDAAPVSDLDPDSLPVSEDPGGTPGSGETARSTRLLMVSGFACMVGLGLALMLVSGIGLARRGRLE